MNDMRELIDLPTAERLIRLVAIGLPIVGVVIGLIVGAIRKQIGKSGLGGLLIGLAGPLIWLLWLVYNRVMNHYGLDSVKGLLINLALFVVVGLGLGFGIAWVRRRFGEVAGSEEV